MLPVMHLHKGLPEMLLTNIIYYIQLQRLVLCKVNNLFQDIINILPILKLYSS